jgi:RNA polymerase sigma-70 factor (ECF subfamily)
MAIDELSPLTAALNGDQDAFERLVAPYRRELLVHCYRFLGALEDAEDMLQETLLRAWRGLHSYAGRASFRAWLYKIATNVCLDGLDRRRARALPDTLFPPAAPGSALPAPVLEPVWLEPLPDSALDELLAGPAADPEAAYEARESVSLAFLAVLQQLPGRQRAALILRDVLGFSAEETAQMLDLSTAAVNSALQRARATMDRQVERPAAPPPAEGHMAELLGRYMQAWESADSAGLVRLLRDDVVLTMPPVPLWYRGQAAVHAFLDGFLFMGQAAGRFKLQAARANAGPACVVYERQTDGRYTPSALQVLTIGADGQIATIHDFLTTDPSFFERFGAPASL